LGFRVQGLGFSQFFDLAPGVLEYMCALETSLRKWCRVRVRVHLCALGTSSRK